MKIKTEDKNTILCCKACSKSLNITVDRCIHCGVKDPFYFKLINKEQFWVERGFWILLLAYIILGFYVCRSFSWWWLVLFIPLGIGLYELLQILYEEVLKKRLSCLEDYIDSLEKLEGEAEDVWSKYFVEIVELDL